MTYSVDCDCDKCRNQINAGAEVFCFWCYEELKNNYEQLVQQVCELKEIIKVLNGAKEERKCHAKSH